MNPDLSQAETADAFIDTSYMFQGREVTLPVIVRKARSGNATFLVDRDAAQALIPGPELEVAEFVPGKTLFSLACIDYIQNDLGDYNEISMAFFVRERGTPRGLPYAGSWIDFLRSNLGTYIHRLPVDQAFTCEAGCGIWGFPKTVETIDFVADGDRATCRLEMGGAHVLTMSVPRGGTSSIPEAHMSTYSYIDGVAHKTPFSSAADGVGFSLGGATLELGNHPVADELRSLGLPKSAVMSMWMESMRGRFDAPEPL
jgi:hypothetical protein